MRQVALIAHGGAWKAILAPLLRRSVLAKNLSKESMEAIEQIAFGAYDNRLATFDEKELERHWHAFSFVVFGFVRRFCLREFHIVKGDPLIAMVASEIWLYNTTRVLLKDGGLEPSELSQVVAGRGRMERCNAHSISQYLGIPPETVRRKVKALMEMGWVDKSKNGHLTVTRACEDALYPESNVETMRDFISTARHLFKAMGLTIAINKEDSDAMEGKVHGR